MKKLLIITMLFIAAFTKGFAQSGDLEVVGIDPSIPTISLNGTSELILVINQNGPQDLPIGSARVNIAINQAILNWILPITLTDDCGGLWTIQTANPTAATPQIQIRNSSVLPFLASCIVRIPVKGIAVGTGSVNVTSTVFGGGASDPNGTNQGANTEIKVVTPPVATNDNASTTGSPVNIPVLTNDTPGSAPIDVTKVMLIDPNDGTPKTSVTIPGQGTYTVNTSTGLVTFTPDPALTTTTVSTITYTITDTSGQTSTPATITTTITPLPVTLTVFKVTKEGTTALLDWATTQETNSDYFEIQHSVTGKDWNVISKVASHGESNVERTYKFTDVNPVKESENLYRLKMVDKDATFAYSRIQSLKFDGKAADLSVYPNPSSDKIFIRDYSDVKEIVVSDMNGRSVYQSESFAKGNGSVDVKTLSPGMYIIKVSRTNGTTSAQKIIVGK